MRHRTYSMHITLICISLISFSIPSNAAVMEEIIITAQKREQNLQDVGISVTAFTGDQIEQLGFTTAIDITEMTPGLHYVKGNSEATFAFSMRGVVNSEFATNHESPISVYVDEVYVSQLGASGFALFDIERAEVLRGPQGILFGRNSTGGLVQFITRKPSQEFDGYGKFTFGEYEQVNFEGAVGGGISENLSARVSVSTNHNSGYVWNRYFNEGTNNDNDYYGRVQLLFDPNENVDFLLNVRGAVQEIRTGFLHNEPARFDAARGGAYQTPGLTDFSGYVDTDGDVHAGEFGPYPGYKDLYVFGASGTLTWDISDNMTLTSITDYTDVQNQFVGDSDGSRLLNAHFMLDSDARHYIQELRLAGERERMNWTAGFFYMDLRADDSSGAPLGLCGLIPGCLRGPNGDIYGLDAPYTTEKESWSIFGHVEYQLTDRLSAILGVRYIDEKVDHTYENNAVEFPEGGRTANEINKNPNIIATAGAFEKTYDKGLWSARVGLDWTISDDLLFYASWNRGVKGGAFNSPFDYATFLGTYGDPDAVDIKEETLNAFEAGIKSTIFDGRARLNVGGYYYDYKNYQGFQFVNFSALIINSDAESYGFEAELHASPNSQLDLLFGVAFNDSEIDLQSGLLLPAVQSPKWNLNGMARYEWPAFLGNVSIQGDFHYRSKHIFDLGGAPYSSESGYWIVNTRVSYVTENERWEGSFFVDNVFDEEYRSVSFDLAGAFGHIGNYYGKPRWIGGSIKYNW